MEESHCLAGRGVFSGQGVSAGDVHTAARPKKLP